jgi:putative nucleotidyltransferase with HDIG domain
MVCMAYDMPDPVILFVDDEPNILQGLRGMLRNKRAQWTMLFASSGRQALDIMAETPVDIIVSDMRMPEMNGAALLEVVTREYPSIIRFILSGQSDDEVIFRAIGASHQYLAKPCDSAELEDKISRALDQREDLNLDTLRRAVSELSSVPSLPGVYSELVAELKRGQVTSERLDDIVARDPGLLAKILQLSNSAYFGLAKPVRSVHQAVNYLGFDTIRSLALCYGIIVQLSKTVIGGEPVESLVDHSVDVGELAREIAQAEGLRRHDRDDAYVAGLLHEIGILVLAENLYDVYEPLLIKHRSDGSDLIALERAAISVDHATIGAYLLGTWGLPDPIVEAVAKHHSASGHTAFDSAAAVHIAEAMVTETALKSLGEATEGSLIAPSLLAAIGKQDRLPHWLELSDRHRARRNRHG